MCKHPCNLCILPASVQTSQATLNTSQVPRGTRYSTMPPKRKTDPCAVLNLAIVDGRDEALFCEGKCQAWLYCGCVSVRSEQHRLLTASTEPFLCPTCGQEHNCNQAQISELKNTVEALKLELSQLKKAFSDLQDQASQPTSINSKSYAAATATDYKTWSSKRRPTVMDVWKKSKPTHQSSKKNSLHTSQQVHPVLYPLVIMQLVIVQLRVTRQELKVHTESGGQLEVVLWVP